MLTDLPVAAVRYAALLNTAIRRIEPQSRRMIDWIRHDVGVYEQCGFADLPWLVQWPHEKAIWELKDTDARLAELARQEYRSDDGSADNTAGPGALPRPGQLRRAPPAHLPDPDPRRLPRVALAQER